MLRKTAVCLCLILLVLPCAALAQEKSQGLTVSPTTEELSLQPGSRVEATVKVSNPTNRVIEVYPLAMNFTARGETGEPAFYPAQDTEKKFSLADWVQYDQTKIALTPEQVTEWKYKIAVPVDAEPGGHYGVVFFATKPPAEFLTPKQKVDISKIGIASMVGTLVLVVVPGAVVESGSIAEFTAPSLMLKPPVNFTVRLENTGNVHFKPKGIITAKNTWGSGQSSVSLNPTGGNILPASTRRFEVKWGRNSFWAPVGRYTAKVRITYGEKEKVLTGTLSFWIIPWWFILAIILFIALVVGLVIWLVLRRRKREGQTGRLGQVYGG